MYLIFSSGIYQHIITLFVGDKQLKIKKFNTGAEVCSYSNNIKITIVVQDKV